MEVDTKPSETAAADNGNDESSVNNSSNFNLPEQQILEKQSANEQISQLQSAKQLAFSDFQQFPRVFDTIVEVAENISSSLFIVKVKSESLEGSDAQEEEDSKPLVIRWCLEFFIQIYSDDRVDNSTRKSSSSRILKTLTNLIRVLHCFSKLAIFQQLIQLASLIFNFVFLNVIEKVDSYEEIWANLTELKGLILSKLNTEYPVNNNTSSDMSRFIGPKLFIIKFISIVIQTQLPTPPEDPRKRGRKSANSSKNNDVSSAMAKNHPLINENLKAEAMGLLDLLLNLVTESKTIVPQINSAIFFVLITLIRKRPSVTTKVLNQLVLYDSFKKLTLDLHTELIDDKYSRIQSKLLRRFSDRSFKIFLNYLFKNNILTSKSSSSSSSANDNDSSDMLSTKYYNRINYIIQYQDKQRKDKNLMNDLPEDIAYFEYLKKKFEEEKQKSKIDAIVSNSQLSIDDLKNINKHYPNVSLDELYYDPTKPSIGGSSSYSSLFTLTDQNNELNKFDVSLLNNDILTQLIILAINKTNTERLSTALNVIGERYKTIINRNGEDGIDSTSDSHRNKRIRLSGPGQADPFSLNGNGSSGNSYSSLSASATPAPNIDERSYGNLIMPTFEYVLPEPKLLTFEEKKQHLNLIISNYLKLANSKALQTLINNQDESAPENNSTTKNGNTGAGEGIIKMSKVAIPKWEKNSWAIILIRLATRGLYNGDDEGENQELSDLVRNALFTYFLESIHSRMDVVIEWLNEEWYSEYVKAEAKLIQQQKDENNGKDKTADEIVKEIRTPTYIHWTTKILDTIIPFLETKDRKIFIRLLSDLPYLNKEIILKLRSLCIDRLRFNLGLQSLQYLIMVRPPVKDICIEMLEGLCLTEKDNEELVAAARKLLKKYAPGS